MDAQDLASVFAVVLFFGAIATFAGLFHPHAQDMYRRWTLHIAAAVAVGATVGSLYFSEVAGFLPCDMCWVQRIFMYPLALILPVAAVRRQREIALYGIILAGVGLLFSLYHVQIQIWPNQSTSCDPLNPCSGKYVEALGFATIPQMAGLSFVLILAALVTQLRSR
jgi:disulfide bond formation protein DsbB